MIKKAKVTKLNMEGNKCTGLTYTFNNEDVVANGPVILATGGYAADFSDTSLLKKHRPDTFDLSTTNGAHATGDGHKMLIASGANDIDMDKVQVHPTGLVDPKDPGAKTKFLAAEALRGEGGLLLNNKGQRFVDELQHRDFVSDKMWVEKDEGRWPIRLVLNSKASNVLDFHTRHYSGRGLMKKMSGQELIDEIGCGRDAFAKTFKDYNTYANGDAKDPFEKKYFHNGPMEVDDTFYVAQMEPVLHFTMGGIEINDKAQCLNGQNEPFEGLFVCGELAGGVHGSNRLGGSSLLGCVVYGRVAGSSASKYMFQELLQHGGGTAVQRAGQISLHIDPSMPGRISVDWGQGAGATAGAQSNQNLPISQQSQQPVEPLKGTDSAQSSPSNRSKKMEIPDKEYTLEEVAKHNTKEDLWIAVKGIVLELTDWVDEHPGGPQALYSQMGKEASEEFEMLHDGESYLQLYMCLNTDNFPDEVIPKYASHTVIGRVAGQEVTLEY